VLATTEQTIPLDTEHASGGPQSGPVHDAFGAQGRSPASLDSEATSVSRGIAKKSPLVSVSDWARPGRARMAERYAKLAESRDSAWHRSRALSLGVDIAERVAHCGQETVTLQSVATGEILERPVECRQRLCKPCCDKRARRTAGRIARAFDQLDKWQAKRGRHKQMITFTCRHSGSASLDAKRLQAAWKRLRSSFSAKQVTVVRKATGDKTAKPRMRGFAFCRVLELSGGTDKTGHAHFHVVAYLPRWNSYEWFQQAWRKALWAADCEIQADLDWNMPSDCMGSGNVDFAKDKPGKSATMANYVSKVANYIGKAGTDLLDLDEQAAGEFLGEFIGRRWVTTSVGFWPVVTDRPKEWILAELPEGRDLRHLAGWWQKVPAKPPDSSG